MQVSTMQRPPLRTCIFSLLVGCSLEKYFSPFYSIVLEDAGTTNESIFLIIFNSFLLDLGACEYHPSQERVNLPSVTIQGYSRKAKK